MKTRTMDWPARYGLDHPTWAAPDCFTHATAEDAQDSIVKVYGENSGHVVVCLSRVEGEPT